jgi:hypothetical protein
MHRDIRNVWDCQYGEESPHSALLGSTIMPQSGLRCADGGKYIPRRSWLVDCVWNVMAHAQKPNIVFRRNGRVQLNRRGRQFCRLLAAEVCASDVVMLDTPCSVVVWRVLATHSICQFPLHFPTRASPYAITFQLQSTHGQDGSDQKATTQGTVK